MDIYAWADRLIDACPSYATGFTELLATTPYPMSPAVRQQYDARFFLIRSFQQTTLELFRAALRGETPPAVLHWLMNETPESIATRYHRGLEDRHFTLPVFFRTDEVRPGRIVEIQCPGSLWGELQLVHDYAGQMGYRGGEDSPAGHFGAQLTRLLQETPVVHHSLDQSSAPAGMRYFIEMTRPRVRYFTIDRGVKARDCNFIRHHSFFGLCADYEFRSRLARAGRGVTYDLPPLTLFDEKAAMVLPFWSLTRPWFTDDMRALFPYTTPLLPAGIELADGTCVSIEAFSQLPQSQRSYYLKYAGADVALNWGSKAVYRLSNLGSHACLDFLRQCLQGYAQGQIWLVQEEEAQVDEITFHDRRGAVHTQNLHAKFCGFYGPEGCLGVLAMHRRHFKVHGQEETVLSYVRTDEQAGAAA
jgi:hypothetical protein